MAFSGFPRSALDFYRGLEADNSKTYWQANKAVYDASVKEPMAAFAAEVDETFRPMHIFRPNRDVRFSKDKSPYKTHTGAVAETDGGAMVYVQLSASGLMAAAGYYMMRPDQLARYREAIDSDAALELEAIAAALARQKLPIASGGEGDLKTAPKGYPRDHPRIDWLRRKGLIIVKEFGAPSWMTTRAALTKIQDLWRAAEPLNGWLDTHVGPSLEAPEDVWSR
ncbi:MAG: DUF2461 domain-containing protein [Acidimicrobiia bacterium]